MGHYKVIFLGLVVASPEEEVRLLKGLQKRFNLTPQRAESLLQRVPIVVKKGTSKEDLQKYVKVFEEIGGKVRMEEEDEAFPEPPRAQQEAPRAAPREILPTPAEPLTPGRSLARPSAPVAEERGATPAEAPQPSREISPREGTPMSPETSAEEAAHGAPEEAPRIPPEEFARPSVTPEMTTCPRCGFQQPDTDVCANCGTVLSEYRPEEEARRAKEGRARKAPPEAQRICWESGEGFLGSFFHTVKECLFSPTRFYRKVANGNEYWSPLLYGVICNIIGSGVSILWAWYFLFAFSHYLHLPSILRELTFSNAAIKLISLPFFAAFFILFYTVVVHVCLIIVGGNKSGFRASFRAVSYAFSGDLLRIIPVVGWISGWVYCLVLAIVGARECHNISTGRAVLAVLLPMIVMVGFFVLGIVFLPMILGPTRFFSGVGV